MSTNGVFERNELNVSAGKWAAIRKESFRETNLEHAVFVPGLQAALVGLASGLCAAVLLGLLGGAFALAAGGGLVVGLVVCTVSLFDGFVWARRALDSLEVWESEAAQQGSVERSEVRIEVVERESNHGYGRVVYDVLGTSHAELALVAQEDTTLSKRGLMSLGFSDTVAMVFLQKLLEFGYIARTANNAPAQWTSKGRALCRAFAGGGGGGGEG